MVITVSSSSSEDEEVDNHLPKQASASRRQRRTKKVTYVELSDDPLDDDDDANDPDASLSANSSSDDGSSYSAPEGKKSAPPPAKRRKLSGAAKGTLRTSTQASNSKKSRGKGSSQSTAEMNSLGLSVRSKSKKGSTGTKKDTKVNLKRRKLKIDEEADKIQAEALKKVLERGLLERYPLDLGAEHGKKLPEVLLRCNMSQITVKKASRKRERKYMFVFPGQLAVLDHGISGSIQGLSTNKPTLTLDLQGGASVMFYGSVVHPKNDYVVMECKQNGKQVNCHDGMTNLVIFHSYNILGKLTTADTETPDLDALQWENPSTFEKEEKTAGDMDDDDDDDEAQDTDEELPNNTKKDADDNGDKVSKPESKRVSSRAARKKKVVSYIESGSDNDGEETPESEGGYD